MMIEMKMCCDSSDILLPFDMRASQRCQKDTIFRTFCPL